MINTTLNKFGNHQTGASVLGLTLILLLSLSIIIFFTAYTVVSHQKLSSNFLRTDEAFNAAQAGLEYGLSYLNENKSTVTNSMTLSGTLSNNSTYNIQYTFAGAGGSNDSILIQSTGTSADATATQSIQELVTIMHVTGPIMDLPALIRDSVDIGGSAIITNLENNNTINAGEEVDFSGSSHTTIASGTGSDKDGLGPDVTENNPALSGMTTSEFELSILGRSIASFQGLADVSYSFSSSHNYSDELSGKEGIIVWITQSSGDASLGGTNIGTDDNPVTIVINGDAKINGNITIYGNLFVSGDLTISGNLVDIKGLVYAGGELDFSGNNVISGGVASADELEMSGNAQIVYSTTILSDVATAGGPYGIVTGSWRDF